MRGTPVKTRLRDRVSVCQQHIRKSEYQKFKVEEPLKTYGKGAFKIFPFLQMQSSDTTQELQRKFHKKI